jgi:hypothetical protein
LGVKKQHTYCKGLYQYFPVAFLTVSFQALLPLYEKTKNGILYWIKWGGVPLGFGCAQGAEKHRETRKTSQTKTFAFSVLTWAHQQSKRLCLAVA